MEPNEKDRAMQLAAEIDKECNRLQHQVLNNIDSLFSADTKVDRAVLDQLVKKPIMDAVTKMRQQRLSLLKLASTGTHPNSQQQQERV